MFTYLRYALATICFAASVGCLALWWRSVNNEDYFIGRTDESRDWYVDVETADGYAIAGSRRIEPQQTAAIIWHYGESWGGGEAVIGDLITKLGPFGVTTGPIGSLVHFPLWYPALIFALAGVASLRLGRRFTIRSAIIATTVVAVLLGMAVIL